MCKLIDWFFVINMSNQTVTDCVANGNLNNNEKVGTGYNMDLTDSRHFLHISHNK